MLRPLTLIFGVYLSIVVLREAVFITALGADLNGGDLPGVGILALFCGLVGLAGAAVAMVRPRMAASALAGAALLSGALAITGYTTHATYALLYLGLATMAGVAWRDNQEGHRPRRSRVR